MPRLARLDAPGVLHHVIIPGIERNKIFRDKADQDNFMDRLSRLIPESQTACYKQFSIIGFKIDDRNLHRTLSILKEIRDKNPRVCPTRR
ncbi:MAG: hypothetical protein JRD05_11135 [Deltaproteobacteria bacterium]|nr:hypothetical protein [Deltaproteobacteria bacterium]